MPKYHETPIYYMGEGNTIDEVFELAISCENLAGVVYGDFTKKFAHEPEIVDFWKDMIEDEKKHAESLKEIHKTLSPEQLGLPADLRLVSELKNILTLTLEDVTKDVKTLDDAYEVANDLENSEVNAAFRMLMNEFVPVETRRRAILGTVEIHLGRLINFSENYGAPEWRKTIVAK